MECPYFWENVSKAGQSKVFALVFREFQDVCISNLCKLNKSPATILLFQWRKLLGMYFILALLNYMHYNA